jgi:Uma2 family endonuclease
MATASSQAAEFDNVGDLLERLGNIPPHRIRLRPPPGQATERDVIALLDHENRLFELVDGTLVEKVMGFRESYLAMEVGRMIGNFVEENDLGVVAGADGTVRLFKGMVRISDVAFVSWARLPGRKIPRAPIPDLAPDLAVEVLSEGNTKQEMARKLKDYFFAGVRLVWFVEPDERTVEVFTAPDQSVVLREGQALDGGDVLPGLKLPLALLFRRIPEEGGAAGKGRRSLPRKGKPRRRGNRA